jgi:hypothetical protein
MSPGIVRAWLLTALGTTAVIVGLIETNPTYVMFGFAVLGAEPVTRGCQRSEEE